MATLLRTWLAFIAFGSAVALGYRGNWAWAVVALAAVLVPVAGRLRASWMDARAEAVALHRGPPQSEPQKPALVPVPRPRERYDHPPWVTAEMPAMGHAASCPWWASMTPDAGHCRCDVRAAARVPLP
jgi:hypothetical protein